MKKIRQIMAWIGIIVIVGLVITTFVLGITGSSYFMGMLSLTMGVSITIWAMLWFLQVLGKRNTENDSGNKQDEEILSPQSISKYLLPEYDFIELEVYKSIDSTNTRIKEYAAQGKAEGLVVVAEEQSAGRGRLGRSFYSPSTSGVYVSFLLRPKFTAQESLFLTTAAAVAAAEAIEEVTGTEAVIKWVNDVFCHGKKVCGILTEASVNEGNNMLEYAVTGIGFNLWEPEDGFPEDICGIAGAILPCKKSEGMCGKREEAIGKEFQTGELRSQIVAAMIQHFWRYYEHLTEKSFMAEYKRRSFLLGKEVYTVSDAPMKGIAVDIDEDGHLILECKDGSRVTLSSGEVSVRPVS